MAHLADVGNDGKFGCKVLVKAGANAHQAEQDFQVVSAASLGHAVLPKEPLALRKEQAQPGCSSAAGLQHRQLPGMTQQMVARRPAVLLPVAQLYAHHPPAATRTGRSKWQANMQSLNIPAAAFYCLPQPCASGSCSGRQKNTSAQHCCPLVHCEWPARRQRTLCAQGCPIGPCLQSYIRHASARTVCGSHCETPIPKQQPQPLHCQCLNCGRLSRPHCSLARLLLRWEAQPPKC